MYYSQRYAKAIGNTKVATRPAATENSLINFQWYLIRSSDSLRGWLSRQMGRYFASLSDSSKDSPQPHQLWISIPTSFKRENWEVSINNLSLYFRRILIVTSILSSIKFTPTYTWRALKQSTTMRVPNATLFYFARPVTRYRKSNFVAFIRYRYLAYYTNTMLLGVPFSYEKSFLFCNRWD